MAVLTISNLHKSFGDLKVLRGISLEVEKGEVVAVIGPSGGGKSTLLRCATMLERIDAGSIRYLDTPAVTDGVYQPEAALRRIKTMFGLVFQNFNLFPHYNVMKNLCDAPICVQKRDPAEVAAAARRLLAKMGLADRENYYPYQLSGGQQQRVSIARALINNPEILFFDEPTSALDPELTGEILRVIRNLAAERMTMVIVTHEIEFARRVADRVVFMAGGVIVEQGTPEAVLEHPEQERTRSFLSKLSANG